MPDRLTKRNLFGDAVLCDRLQGIGICLDEDIERVAQYEDEREEQRWISVDEHLPESGGYYLVHQCDPRYGISIIQHGRYSRKRQRWVGAQALCSLDYVTHWMPMPAPPKGVKNAD